MTTVAPAGPRVNGRFLEADGRRFLVKGVTYGTFAPDPSGGQYPLPAQIDEDFRLMAQAGFNTVRVYTVPEMGLLDTAARHDLRVMRLARRTTPPNYNDRLDRHSPRAPSHQRRSDQMTATTGMRRSRVASSGWL